MTGPPHYEDRDTDLPAARGPGVFSIAGGSPGVDRLGWALAAAAALAVGLAGSVRPGQQAAVHFAVAGVALVAAGWGEHRLVRGGAAARLTAMAAIGPALCALSLLWAPRILVSAAAPGIAEARPGASWLPLSAAPEATAGELGRALLVVTLVAVAATWGGARSHAARRLSTAVAIGGVALAFFAAAHALSGADRILGVLAVGTTRDPFFAPLVNPNHLGALLALALPATLGAARDGGRAAPAWWAGSVLVGALLLALQSPGAWLAAGVAVSIWAVRETGVVGRVVVAVAGLAGVGVLVAGGSHWVESSVERRLSIWRDLPAMGADHWLFGIGGGAFGEAFPPYRTSSDWEHVVHAHSDWLEGLVEHGVIGVVAGGVVLFFGVRWWAGARIARKSASPFPGRVAAGLVGVVVQATWEFALQIPGVLVVTSIVLAALIAATTVPRSIDAGWWRRLLLGLAATQVLVGAWALRESLADEAAATIVRARAPDDATDRAERVLALTAPWRGERAVYAAWAALASGDTEGARTLASGAVARYPHDPDTLRRAGLVLARSGEPAAAEAALRRSIDRDPDDYRSWAGLARLLSAQGRNTEALAAWRDAITRWPWQYEGRGDPIEEAWPLLPVGLWWIQALGDAPGFWSLELAKHLEKQGDDAEAYLAIEQAVRLRPAYIDSVTRGVLLYRLGHLEEAEGALRRMMITRPDVPGVGLELGHLLIDAGRPQEGLVVFGDTARRHPEYEPVRIAHVRGAAKVLGSEEAVAVARSYLLDGQGRPGVALEMARQEAAAGRPGDCLRTLAARVPPSDPILGPDREAVRLACRAACPKCEDPE